LQNAKRKTVGVRLPDHIVTQALLRELNEPLMSSTLILPGDDLPMIDPYQIRLSLEHQVDLVIDGGFCGHEPTTVVDLMESRPQVLREGKGSIGWLVEH
jgi:tRNA threonylcarbamoyl adenosine modification protein (Sua5/YciO/YrdC/YwlC family)